MFGPFYEVDGLSLFRLHRSKATTTLKNGLMTPRAECLIFPANASLAADWQSHHAAPNGPFLVTKDFAETV